jgi:rhodanese-related sulfurtransferase
MAANANPMLEAADAAVARITLAEAPQMIAAGNRVVVAVRDAPEVEHSGKLAAGIRVSRGMPEFRADPDSPYHDKNFSEENTLLLHCASADRSAPSAKVLKDMGYEWVYNLGVFKDWAESGGPIDKPIEARMNG